MTENPYQSPNIGGNTGLQTWRKRAGVALGIVTILPAALAALMAFAGVRWLIIEHENDLRHSLSIALLAGATLSAVCAAGLFWIARRLLQTPPSK